MVKQADAGNDARQREQHNEGGDDGEDDAHDGDGDLCVGRVAPLHGGMDDAGDGAEKDDAQQRGDQAHDPENDV